MLVTGLDQVLYANGIYLMSGWVITPWCQTLQSLGTTQRCKPPRDPVSVQATKRSGVIACIWIIEYSVNCISFYMYSYVCIILIIWVKFSYEYSLFTLACPSSVFLSCVVYLSFAMITYSVEADVVVVVGYLWRMRNHLLSW